MSGNRTGFVVPRKAPVAAEKGPGCTGNVSNTTKRQLESCIPLPHKAQARAFKVLYAQRSSKKRNNKQWQDGILLVAEEGNSRKLTVHSSEGKTVVVASRIKELVEPETVLQVGNWDVEVDAPMHASEVRSGACFIDAASNLGPISKAVHPVSASGPRLHWRGPGLRRTVGSAESHTPAPAQAPDGALVLVPGELAPGGCAIYVDAFLARKLRPHQAHGVQFLYHCLTGRQGAAAANSSHDEEALWHKDDLGCILADEMGLGKTVQVLATSWALMQRFDRSTRPPVLKMLVVAPSSVIKNWGKEIKQWLGMERAAYLVLLPGPDASKQVLAFKAGSRWKVLIASYENIRKHCEILRGCIDLLICDEGHRLKSSALNNTMRALLDLQCQRRVILTGTPVQNNLSEFYAMMSFVRPHLLGPQSAFQRIFVAPIEASQEISASAECMELGHAREAELSRRIQPFLLRRTADVNSMYLPPCLQYVVFIKATETQLAAYHQVLREAGVHTMLDSSASVDNSKILTLIGRLRQACNHPALACATEGQDTPAWQGCSLGGKESINPSASGKLICLRAMLVRMVNAGEKGVIVSTSTRMLDAAEALCRGAGLACGRIDGSTQPHLRQERVDVFNRTDSTMQVFLLSTRAGGAGLNLVGGSRLFLLDSDWNPAMDEQAMARIWRDGQHRSCHIYRLLATGLIDEKMFQRQLYKQALVSFVASGGAGRGDKRAASFSKEELRRLFSVNAGSSCDTLDVLATTDPATAASWTDIRETTTDAVLLGAIETKFVTYAHLQTKRGAMEETHVREPGSSAAAGVRSDEPADGQCCTEQGCKRAKLLHCPAMPHPEPLSNATNRGPREAGSFNESGEQDRLAAVFSAVLDGSEGDMGMNDKCAGDALELVSDRLS